MERPSTRRVSHLPARLDGPGIAAYLIGLWGLALVSRSSYAALCPGCANGVDIKRFAVVGALLSFGVGAWLWIRWFRRAAFFLVLPGVLTVLVELLLPGSAFPFIGMLAVPSACSAAAIALERPGADRSVLIWVFLVSSLFGAAGAGYLAIFASATVGVAALLGPEPEWFAARWHQAEIPDDISGI
jgi:hypothetical protein